ncbi:hypothetical protein B0H19DRAFT_1089702 [Mycena capillaripes]|nr:hypothetical protein B0H19DRAFT_1089702 [Mycena capillaripes]
MKRTETVTAIVSLLGGPHSNANDIDWASDLPAGQRLFEWLASQVELPRDDPSMGNESDALRAALQAISLEEDEVQGLRHATRKATTVPPPAPDELQEKTPSEYIPPWRIRAKEEYLLAEATRLETDTESLKSRLQQTKIASQSLSQAIKFLASEIEKTDSDITTAEDRLSELSLKADAAILASVNGSLGLLDDSVVTDSPKDESSLSAVASARTAIIDRFKSQMHAIDTAEGRLPTLTEMQSECGRLDTLLRNSRADPALNREIIRLCEALEDPGTGKDTLATVLVENAEHRGKPPLIDVTAELEATWTRDQADLLDARGAILDQVFVAFSDVVLPPLTALHDNLAAKNAQITGAHALVGALREEIQDIVEDLHAAQEPQDKPIILSPEESKDVELQVGLTSLLKQLKDLRPRDAPPLVLLSQDDILDELRSVYEREEVSKRREEAWIANLLPALRNLETAHAPPLNAAYQHSPMNTSPPFAIPPDLQTVYADAKSKSDDLENAINKLQEDVKTLTSDRAKKRMEHFVGKWASSR